MTRWALLLLTTIAAAIAALPTEASSSRLKILHLSDIHYDPAYGTPNALPHSQCQSPSASPFGEFGCDSPWSLVTSAIGHAASVADNDTIVIVTGDWVRHDIGALQPYKQVAVNIWRNVTGLMRKAFGGSGAHVHAHPSLPVADVGNEDFVPDYHINVSDPTGSTNLKQYAAVLQSEGFLDATMAKAFEHCGFYSSVSPNHADVEIVSLNTIVYSKSLNPTTNAADPCGQLAWLNATLRKSRLAGKKAVLIGHIPPTDDFWRPGFAAQFFAIVANYNDVVFAQFFGHIHMNSLMAPALGGGRFAAPLFIGGPITKVTTTVPDFGVFEIDTTAWQVREAQHHYLAANNTWQQMPPFTQLFPVSNLTAAGLNALATDLRHNPTLFNNNFCPYLMGGYITTLTRAIECDVGRSVLACNMLYYNSADLLGCEL